MILNSFQPSKQWEKVQEFSSGFFRKPDGNFSSLVIHIVLINLKFVFIYQQLMKQ